MSTNQNNIGLRLKKLRKDHHFTQQYIADKTSVQRGNISHYESGKVLPSAETIISLSKLFNVSTDYILLGKEPVKQNEKIIQLYGRKDNIKKELQDLLEQINQLNEENLYSLKKYLSFLTYDQNGHPTIKEPSTPYDTCDNDTIEDQEENKKQLRIAGCTAAGQPIELPDDPYQFTDLVSVPTSSQADFALRIKGDSMEPDISDDSVVLVRKQPIVETGEISIISIDDTVTCKKFFQYSDHIELVSINKKYPPIIIKREDPVEIRVIGKVLL